MSPLIWLNVPFDLAGKHLINLLAWYFMGIASARDVEAYLNRPDNRGVKLRAKEELWKKLGY
jgi:hypothetical protein